MGLIDMKYLIHRWSTFLRRRYFGNSVYEGLRVIRFTNQSDLRSPLLQNFSVCITLYFFFLGLTYVSTLSSKIGSSTWYFIIASSIVQILSLLVTCFIVNLYPLLALQGNLKFQNKHWLLLGLVIDILFYIFYIPQYISVYKGYIITLESSLKFIFNVFYICPLLFCVAAELLKLLFLSAFISSFHNNSAIVFPRRAS